MTFPLPGANWTYLHGLTLKATTGASGAELEDGFPTFATWTPPDDGQLHRVVVFNSMQVSSAETGGLINLTFETPDGTPQSVGIYNQNQGVGFNFAFFQCPFIVKGGSPVSIVQGTALTAGAAVLWAEIWGL